MVKKTGRENKAFSVSLGVLKGSVIIYYYY